MNNIAAIINIVTYILVIITLMYLSDILFKLGGM